MRISVVIPAFNSAETIQRALASILTQSMRPAEVIVVDDCSKDHTVELVGALQDAFRASGVTLYLLPSARNVGGAVSRNRGLAQASGEAIALMDSDDVWLSHHLQASVKAGKGNDCVVVSRTRQILAGGKKRILPDVRLALGAHPLDYIFRGGGVIQTSSMVLFGQARELRFDERLRKHQDFDFIGAAYRAGLPILQRWDCSNEYHDYGGETRVSVRKNLTASRIFYLKWRTDLKPAARRAFLARFLAQQLPDSKKKLSHRLMKAGILDREIVRSVRLRLIARFIRDMLK
jgi:glycosyltransferase involved in cell wall biosynthesis